MSEWIKTMKASSGPTEFVIVSNFREIVSLRIISAELSFNPSLSEVDVRNAVDVNEPQRFLPQPWPPVDTSTSAGIEVATLIKMKSIIARRTNLQNANSRTIQVEITDRFPSIVPSSQTSDHTRIEAIVSLLENGAVIYEFTHPRVGTLPLDNLENSGDTTISYVQMMLIMGIAQKLEKTRT